MRRMTLTLVTSLWLLSGLQPGLEAATPGGIESQAEFIARCTRESIAANPQSTRWAKDQCTQQWEAVVAAGPMAEAILTAEPATATAVDPTTIAARLSMIQWSAKPQGKLVASGTIAKKLDVQIESSPASLNFYWNETGALIPYDVVEALRARGAKVTMLGCYALDVGETSRNYRVEIAGRAPFALGIYDRSAPTANADSFYNVAASLTGRIPSLAQLRSDGNDWTASCPQ